MHPRTEVLNLHLMSLIIRKCEQKNVILQM